MPNRAQFFFSDGRYGWSEVYYDATAGSLALTETWTRAQKLASFRQNMLATGAGVCKGGPCTFPSLIWTRISNTANPRQTLFSNPSGLILNGIQGQGLIGKQLISASESGVAPDNPYSAVGLILSLANGGQSKRSISGVPDEFICDQAFDPSNGWVKSAQAFVDSLISGPWGALQATHPSTPPAGSVITAITQDAFGHPVITLTTGLPVGCSVRLTVWNYVANTGTPSINGTYRAFPGPATAGLATVWTLRKVFTPLSPLCFGNAIVYTPAVTAFTNAVLTRPTKRSRGRPTALPRGRARIRR